MYVRRALFGIMILAGSALVIGVAGIRDASVDSTPAGRTDTAVTAWWPACTSDDGSSTEGYPCLWDARMHGNGRGQSFISAGPDGPIIHVRVLG